jgi:two-component system response regulator
MKGMKDKIILLIEDNPDDEALTLRALAKNNIKNDVVVVDDGAEALDYLFGTGSYAGRDLTIMPQLTLLDLKLPKVDGLEVLRRLRANEHTRLLPVVILTSSNEEQDRVNVSRLSWKWRKRSSVKIAERTYEKRAQALHC